MEQSDLKAAHLHSSDHRAEITNSVWCGCFYCYEIFQPSAIKEWIADGTCALCPSCSTDTVIGDASGLPVRELSFLRNMHRYWFS